MVDQPILLGDIAALNNASSTIYCDLQMSVAHASSPSTWESDN